MKYFEFGSASAPVAVVLHGGGASYRGAEPAAQLLGERFHVVLVAYDGFNPTEPDTQFRSVMDEAQRLGDFIVERCHGQIAVLYGLSFGCRVLMEVLKDERLTIQAAIADGMSELDVYTYVGTTVTNKMKEELGKVHGVFLQMKQIQNLGGVWKETFPYLPYPGSTIAQDNEIGSIFKPVLQEKIQGSFSEFVDPLGCADILTPADSIDRPAVGFLLWHLCEIFTTENEPQFVFLPCGSILI